MRVEAASGCDMLFAVILIILCMQGVFSQDDACRWYGTRVTVSESSKVTITSPNFPLDYGNNEKCKWRVSVSQSASFGDFIIKATFNEFDLQYHDGSGDCPYDSLTFLDGDSSGNDLIAKFCDTVHPEVIYSTKDGMFIEFESDSTSTYKGFNMTLMAVKKEEGLGLCSPSTSQIKQPIGSGTLYTPQFPIPYPDDTTCIWIITAPFGERVKLTFEVFDLPTSRPYFLGQRGSDGQYCSEDESMVADKVEIRDGPWPDSKLLGIYCGDRSDLVVHSTGRYLWVKFRSTSDGQSENRGIKAPFEVVDPIVSEEQCIPGNTKNDNLRLTGSEGTLQSPMEYYPLNSKCDWLITVPEDSFVKLSFDRFDLGLDGCNSENIKDYVEVLDGKELDSESKGKFCDRTIPPVIRSSGRHMRVVFVSDSYGPFYTGFKATYTAVEKKDNTVQLHLTIAVVILSVILFMVVACLLVQRLKRRKQPRNEAASGRMKMSTIARSDSAAELAGVTEHSPPPTPRVSVAPSTNSSRPQQVGYGPVPTAPNLPPSESPDLVELPPPYPTEEQIPQSVAMDTVPLSGESHPWQQTQASTDRESTF